MSNDDVIRKIRGRLRELELEYERLRIASQEQSESARDPETAVADAETGDYSLVAIDFTGASNLTQRLVRIAQAVDGPLDVRETARCLIQHGLSKAKARNLRSHIINVLRDEPDFSKVGDGKYKYLLKNKVSLPER